MMSAPAEVLPAGRTSGREILVLIAGIQEIQGALADGVMMIEAGMTAETDRMMDITMSEVVGGGTMTEVVVIPVEMIGVGIMIPTGIEASVVTKGVIGVGTTDGTNIATIFVKMMIGLVAKAEHVEVSH